MEGVHRKPRQAVVFIHGMGDQAPMRTLRAFTHGIGLRRLFSSPDDMSGSDDLRRLTEPPTAELRARTDFFEFYWAHHAPDGRGFATLAWAVRLLLRREWRSRHGQVAALVLGLQIAFALGVIGVVTVGVWAVWSAWRGVDVLDGAGEWVLAAVVAALLAHLGVSGFVQRVLSDAVRYLHPSPANVEARRLIRADGLHLLRRLHGSDEYDRVVVVGHSLGAVIGYDLLRSLWNEARHPDPDVAGDQEALRAFDVAADLIDPAPMPPRIPPSTPPPSVADVERFREAQFDLWRADRRDGVPWLVTDFVTVGSPLTYASLLLADPPLPLQGWPGASLAEKQALKEYPRCPPIPDEVEPGRFYTRDYPCDGGERALRVGHTAAHFGPTRWTNLYLPSRRVVLGDLLAGPVAPEFGPGVRDVPVRVPGRGLRSWWRRVFPVSHLSYWWAPHGGAQHLPAAVDLPCPGQEGCESALALASALRLEDIARVPRLPRRRT